MLRSGLQGLVGPRLVICILIGTMMVSTSTLGDGVNGLGSVYQLNPMTGIKTILYSFEGDHDASLPNSLLTYHNGALYGTSGYLGGGGKRECLGNHYGCGAVYKVDISTGAETVLYRFRDAREGGIPEGSVIYHGGALYGTARTGGDFSARCSGYGCGTLFKLTLPDTPLTAP